MHEWQSLSHARWEYKYHAVIIPKYRKRKLYGQLKKRVGEVLREVCRQRVIEVLEGYLLSDHIHMCLEHPSKAERRVCNWLHQRKECCADPSRTHGYQACSDAALLESRILRQHSWFE